MNIQKAIEKHDLILTEAAVIETLKRSGNVQLHPLLENALLIYDDAGKEALSQLYHEFVQVARNGGVPIAICTPTWRANQERLLSAKITKPLNQDAVKFLKRLREKWQGWADKILIGGLTGCKNDAYQPTEGLSKSKAKAFHTWQIDQLAKGGVDFLMAATLPALPEATGIAMAMAETGLPYIISFVINREGRVLDGTDLVDAFAEIDAACDVPPLGYMINCAYPSFLKARQQPGAVMSRIIGYQANASSLDHAQLEGAEDLQTDDLADWGSRMIALNRKFGVQILGGCCGTNSKHLEYIMRHIIRGDSG